MSNWCSTGKVIQSNRVPTKEEHQQETNTLHHIAEKWHMFVMFLPTLLPENLPKGHQLMLLHTNGKDAARIKYKTISFCSIIQFALFHYLLPQVGHG